MRDVWNLANSTAPFRFYLGKRHTFELYDLVSASMISLKPDLGEGEVQMLKEYAQGADTARALLEFAARTRLLKEDDSTWGALPKWFESDAMATQYRKWQNRLLYRYVLGGNLATNVDELYRFFMLAFRDAKTCRGSMELEGQVYFPIQPRFGYVFENTSSAPQRWGKWIERFTVLTDDPKKTLAEIRGLTKTDLPWDHYPAVVKGIEIFTLSLRIDLPSPAQPDMVPIFSHHPFSSRM